MDDFEISEYYNLIFKKKTWIRRISEKIDIEDPEDTKKNISYDLSIPSGLITWKQIDPDNTYSSNQKILPLMFMRKVDLRKVDVTINDKPVSVTSKCNNKLIKNSLIKESEKRIDRYINNFTKIAPLYNELQTLKKDISEGKKAEEFEKQFEDIKTKAESVYKLTNSEIKDIKKRLNAYLYVITMLNNSYVLSILIPSSIHVGDRVIIKVSFELPNKNFSTNQYYNRFKDILKVFSSKYVQDELEYEFETTSLPYSHHVLIDLPKGIKATDFRYAYKDNSDGTDKPGLLYTRNINGYNYDFYNINNIKKGKIYINKDLEPRIKEGELKPSIIKYRAIPEDQGIKRWSFILSFVVPLLVAFGILANFNNLAKGESERSAVVTVLATFSVLFIVWMAKGVEIPIYARTVLPLRISILLYLIGTYIMIIVVIIGDGSNIRINDNINLPVWNLGWMCIYAIFSAATGYSLIVHIYYYSLRLEHMYWNVWWRVLRQGCIFVGVLGSLVLFPIISFLIAHWNLCDPFFIFEWVILCINIIYLFPVSIIGFNKTFRPKPQLEE